MNDITVKHISNYNQFRALEPSWNRLLENSWADNPFLTFEWFDSWLQSFGHDIEPLIITAEKGSKLVGIAPLAKKGKERIFFLGYPHNDYADFIIEKNNENVIGVLLAYLLGGRFSFKKILLDQVPRSSKSMELIGDFLESKKIPYRMLRSDSCPAMVLDNFKENKKKYYKRNIVTYINQLNKKGELKFEIYKETGEILPIIDRFFQQHISRRDLTPFPSQFVDLNNQEFHRNLVQKMCPKQKLKFAILSLDNEPIAFYLLFEYNKILYLYTTTYNIEFAKQSPGQVMLRYLFDYSTQNGLAQLDFTRGDESYKYRFSNNVKQNMRIVIYGNSISKIMADFIYRARNSRIADMLLRNKKVQSIKLSYIYNKRKHGMVSAILKSFGLIFK